MIKKVKLNLHIVESNLFKSSACFGTHLLAKASRKETMIITFTVYKTKDNSINDLDHQTYRVEGTLQEINEKVISLTDEQTYFEPSHLQWKGISANVNNDLAELIQIIDQMPDFSKV